MTREVVSPKIASNVTYAMKAALRKEQKRLASDRAWREKFNAERAAKATLTSAANRQLAIEFIDWARRAGIEPVRLPRSRKLRRAKPVFGWVISTREDPDFFEAVTVDLRVVDCYPLDGTLFNDASPNRFERVASYVARNAPNIPWKLEEARRPWWHIFGQ